MTSPALTVVPDPPQGRVVLVTGANRGIGLSIARAFENDGHRVAITYRSSAPEVPGGLLCVPCDVTDTEQVNAAFDKVEAELGPVEVLVSNAGITADGLMLRMKDEDIASVLDTNLVGSFRVARRAAQRMVRARFGRIVLMGSVVGTIGQAGQANYSAAKAGMVGLARSLARELASRNVTVNVVTPGPIVTDMLANLGEERQAQMSEAVPLGRLGTPEEVAALVRFLASDEAGYITGAVVPIDGGLGMGAW